jgi:hypothetical protein
MHKALASKKSAWDARKILYSCSAFWLPFGLLLFGESQVFADDNGQLQLDPNVITNSAGGAGGSNDFSILVRLFSPELNQVAQRQRPHS